MNKILGVVVGFGLLGGSIFVWRQYNVDGLIACIVGLSGLMIIEYSVQFTQKNKK